MYPLSKKMKEYVRKYGDVPFSDEERLALLIEKLQLKNTECGNLKKCFRKLRSIKQDSYRFILYLTPEPAPRPRLMGNTRHFYVRGARDNNEVFRAIVDEADFLPMITTPASMKLVSYLPIPSAMNRYEKFFAEMGYIRPVSTPDWDNLAKAYCDMIQKHLLVNDSLIWKGESVKFYSVKPRIDLQISFDLAYDCQFNHRKITSSKFYTESEYQDRFMEKLQIVLDLNKLKHIEEED